MRLLGAAALAGSATASLISYGAAHYLVNELVKLRPLEAADVFTFTPFETNVESEDVSFPTANERLLKGWWLPRQNERRVVITVSGYRGKKEDMLGLASHLWRNNFNVLMFDYRGHGAQRAEDELITLGHRELQDMEAAISYACSRIEHPLLGLLGGSMGASVALVAAARNLDVKAVWADSPFTSQRDIIDYVWRQRTHLPSHPVTDIAARLFETRTGHRWEHFSPIDVIGQITPRPVYLVHSAEDKMIPVEHTYRLFEVASEPKSIWIEEAQGHCGVYFMNRAEYVRRVVHFFGENLVDLSGTRSVQKSTSHDLGLKLA
ncbi:MAG TPA: alpha/beta hydrolase [Chloroflexia bacterium]|nr:alpha/beta hydrolase [Chloroflexia bacterium]